MTEIKVRERKAIIQSLKAGVVPKLGLQHIQVGRQKEIEQCVRDLDNIKNGASSFRFIIGDYGSGKTFFLFLTRLIALKQNFVVMNTDLAHNRRIYSSSGDAQALYRELTQNLSTRSKTSGDAMQSILERFINRVIAKSQRENNSLEDVLDESLDYFRNLNGGYVFAEVIKLYLEGHQRGDENLQLAAMRWLRGEYTTKTDAKRDLGVRKIIADDNYFDYLKLFSRFVKEAGYKGLMICFDEMVNICLVGNRKTRDVNYEFLLRMLNDVLQGESEYLGIIMGGTTEFLEDSHKGIYSHDALRSRLAPNSFATSELVDLSGPVIKLPQFNREECFSLLQKVRAVLIDADKTDLQLPDEALQRFLEHCFNYVGEAYFRTPRKTIKAFVDYVSLLLQNRNYSWQALLEKIQVEEDTEEESVPTFYGDNAS